MAGTAILPSQASAAVPSPTAGKATVFVDTDADALGRLAIKRSDGTVIQQTGLYLGSQVVLAGTVLVTANAQATHWKFRLSGGGASGGGCPAVSGEHGSGGGAGGYLEGLNVPVVGGTGYTCAVGASVTGNSGAAGTNGNLSSLTIGVTTYTANGGNAGAVGNSTTVGVQGGAGGASTNGTINVPGASGSQSFPGAAVGSSGAGANSQLGAGGRAQVSVGGGAGATGFGSGGGGAYTTGAVQTGGSSAPGVLIIDEFA